MIGDRAGAVWVGTYDGLNLFKDGKFTVFRKKDGLIDDYILSLFEDRTGAIWMARAKASAVFRTENLRTGRPPTDWATIAYSLFMKTATARCGSARAAAV